MGNRLAGLQMPIANQQIADQQTAANALIAQNQFRNVTQAQAMTGGMQAAQQMGAELAAKQGAVQTGAAQAQAAQTTTQAQNELINQQLQLKAKNDEIRKQLQLNNMSRMKRMNQLGRDVQHKILDAQYKFQQTARGIQFADERQYEDFLTLQQATEIQWKDHLQAVQQAQQSKLQALQFAFDTFSRVEKQMFQSDQQTANQLSVARIRQRKKEIAAEQRRAARKAGRTGQMIGAVTFMAGVAVTAVSASSLVTSGGATWAGVTTGTQMMSQGAQTYQQGNAQANQ